MAIQIGRLRRAERQGKAGVTSAADVNLVLNQVAASLFDLLDDFRRLLQRETLLMPAVPPTKVATSAAFPDKATREKIWARNNLQSISWLRRGLICARSVARIVGPAGTGTGFLIGADLIMTNNYVLPTIEVARNAVAKFNYEEDENGRLLAVTQYGFNPEATFVTDEELDCTIVKLAASDASPIGNWGKLPIKAVSAEIGAPVAIIQHPFGGVKKICVTSNQIVDIFTPYLQYMTDTAGGSSGSPVFNENWNVVALHHAGGELPKNEEGEILYANQGILLGAIIGASKFSDILSKI